MDFPVEMLLIILTYLDVKSLINCGKVSKKIRNISQDESFWRQVNVCNKLVPVKFLNMIIDKGKAIFPKRTMLRRTQKLALF